MTTLFFLFTPVRNFYQNKPVARAVNSVIICGLGHSGCDDFSKKTRFLVMKLLVKYIIPSGEVL